MGRQIRRQEDEMVDALAPGRAGPVLQLDHFTVAEPALLPPAQQGKRGIQPLSECSNSLNV